MEWKHTPMALSARKKTERELKSILDSLQTGHEICSDRKGLLSQFAPNVLIRSSLKIVMTQGGMVFQGYMTDEMENVKKLDKLVDEGRLSAAEAREEEADFVKREWWPRWRPLPGNIFNAYVKYHLAIGTMRVYEHIAEQLVDRITLDKLTRDTQRCAKLLDKETDDRLELGRKMFGVTLWSYFISFLADYSVNQTILVYVWFKARRAPRQSKEETRLSSRKLFCDSGNLAVGRIIEAVCCALGGAVGSIMSPGYGSLFGEAFGDSSGIALADNFKFEI